MIKRRTFLYKTALSALGLSLNSCLEEAPPPSKREETKVVKTPIVVATWNRTYGTDRAMEILHQGGSALDAVEEGVKVVEANPKDVTVGYGGMPDRNGDVTLDACIMDHLGNAGSVTCLKQIKHPTSVARKIMEQTPHVMLSGDGALQFALSCGFKAENLLTPSAEQAWKRWLKKREYAPKINVEQHDTIGMLALDEHGNLSGACTTSGIAFKMPGRVGDSPIIGAGLFVDNEVGAACATGLGEMVLRTLGSFLVVEFMRQGLSPKEACKQAVERIVAKHAHLAHEYQVGFVALSKTGETGAYSVRKGFSYTVDHASNPEVRKSDFMLT
ncbi:MAG: N(4)-(beta-N-acetylglucosaminyl)-L-asparaginase [Bacteroidota bacterium]